MSVYEVYHRMGLISRGIGCIDRSLLSAVHMRNTYNRDSVAYIGDILLLVLGQLGIGALGRSDLILVTADTRERLSVISVKE